MRFKMPSMSVEGEVIEVTNNNTKEKTFLLKSNQKKDDVWIEITEDEYNKILRGN